MRCALNRILKLEERVAALEETLQLNPHEADKPEVKDTGQHSALSETDIERIEARKRYTKIFLRPDAELNK